MAKIEKGDAAPDVTLRDATGTLQRLSELWRERPLVLAFLRHFG
jgi:peroxiredoxin